MAARYDQHPMKLAPVSLRLFVAVMEENTIALYRGTPAIRTVTLNEPWAQRRLALCVRAEESLPSVARLLVDHLRNPPGLAATP